MYKGSMQIIEESKEEADKKIIDVEVVDEVSSTENNKLIKWNGEKRRW